MEVSIFKSIWRISHKKKKFSTFYDNYNIFEKKSITYSLFYLLRVAKTLLNKTNPCLLLHLLFPFKFNIDLCQFVNIIFNVWILFKLIIILSYTSIYKKKKKKNIYAYKNIEIW